MVSAEELFVYCIVLTVAGYATARYTKFGYNRGISIVYGFAVCGLSLLVISFIGAVLRVVWSNYQFLTR